MRSKLFVPCSRPELFAKALAGEADALSFDLEDSVPEAGKAAARGWLVECLSSDAARSSAKRLIVRVNAFDTPHFAADVAALAGLRLDLVNLPKGTSPEIVTAAVEACTKAVGNATDILVTIETPAALRTAAAIGAAHQRVVGLQAGLNDLFEGLGIDRRDPRHIHAASWALRLAAGEAGCFAYDGAWPDLADAESFRDEAMLARGLGFVGKSCIHPSQVTIANAVFDTVDEEAAAERLLSAAAEAAAVGRGAFRFEGRMVDAPAIERARRTLARAGRDL